MLLRMVARLVALAQKVVLTLPSQAVLRNTVMLNAVLRDTVMLKAVCCCTVSCTTLKCHVNYYSSTDVLRVKVKEDPTY